MEYLSISDEIIKSKKILFINNFNYNCFEIIDDYLDIEIYYNLLNSVEEFRLKNIWNYTVSKWNNMNITLIEKKDKKFIKSLYNKKYDQIHININPEKINDQFNLFINNDLMKALFVINCIQNYFYK
jgi:hypothetical protein